VATQLGVVERAGLVQDLVGNGQGAGVAVPGLGERPLQIVHQRAAVPQPAQRVGQRFA
jgi:hypothetical protein